MTLGRLRGRAVALLYAIALGSCTVAQGSEQAADPGVDTMSSGRFGAILATLVALIGMALGALALARSAGRIDTRNGRRRAIIALVAGLSGIALGGLVVASSAGGVGTGNGVGGAIIAMLAGLIGVILGGLALARARHSA